MKTRRALLSAVLALVALVPFLVAPVSADPPPGPRSTNAHLEMYEAVVDAATADRLAAAGYDVVLSEPAPGGVRIVLVLYPWDRQAIEKQGIALEVWQNADGVTATQLSKAQATSGYKVFRDYDGPDGIHAYLTGLAAANPDLLELKVIGTTHGTDPEGDGPDTPREILAARLTADADAVPENSRPAALFASLQHAREWISVEVNRRQLEWLVKMYREDRSKVAELLQSTELWFVLVANPDGYQYTFTHDRLWRKNLRDNNGDNQIGPGDGVDPNRNFPEHWNYDDEGSSSAPGSETYRGPAPASEPETQAMIGLFDDVDFPFMVNYHSFGELILYSFGYQVNTPSADDPILTALAGTDAKPAIDGYDPGVSADLYTTNGETTDWAHSRGTLAFTPELGDGPHDDGFVFPDKEGQVQREFTRNQGFALSVAQSAADPDDPVSSTRIEPQPFYLAVSEIDPQKSHNPMSDFRFSHSYDGSNQPVQVLAKRDLDGDGDEDPVSLNYSVNGGPAATAPTTEWDGGGRYGSAGDLYYHVVRGAVTGADVGDVVEVWFTGAGRSSGSFSFDVVEGSPSGVLVVAAEDYTGASNVPAYSSATAPNYLAYHTDALAANGIDFDVYDVDAMGRVAPDHLGVLGHYDAVVWYTGNDLLTREPGQPGGTGASTLANSEMLELRAYLNEGGRLLYSGRHAGWQYANAFDYQPVATPPYCDNVDQTADDGCLALSDDFLQYWLGAYLFIEDGGTNPVDGEPFGITGTAGGPFDGTAWTLNGGDSADNHHANPSRGTTQSLLTTSSLLDPNVYPQFAGSADATWDNPGGAAFSPHTGSFYVFSDRSDITYKRLARTIDLTGVASGDDPTLSFFISADTEPLWDFVFVEAHTLDDNPDDDWTTLPDQNGHTSQDTGDSCPEGWHTSPDEIHPFLTHYQTWNGLGVPCDPSGTTGEWHAASGRSSGWEPWSIDLSAYAGQRVEVSISYVSDWSIQGLGVWLDDIALSTEAGTESFETGLGAWSVTGPAPGSAENSTDYARTTDIGFREGSVVTMAPADDAFRAMYLAFGLEGVTTAAQRSDLIGRAMAYLLAP